MEGLCRAFPFSRRLRKQDLDLRMGIGSCRRFSDKGGSGNGLGEWETTDGCQEVLRTYLWFVVMTLKSDHSAQLCGLSPATFSCMGWVESQHESGVFLCQERTTKEKVEGTHEEVVITDRGT